MFTNGKSNFKESKNINMKPQELHGIIFFKGMTKNLQKIIDVKNEIDRIKLTGKISV